MQEQSGQNKGRLSSFLDKYDAIFYTSIPSRPREILSGNRKVKYTPEMQDDIDLSKVKVKCRYRLLNGTSPLCN